MKLSLEKPRRAAVQKGVLAKDTVKGRSASPYTVAFVRCKGMRLFALLLAVGVGVVSGSDGYKHRSCRKVGHTNMEGSEDGANVRTTRSTTRSTTAARASQREH